MSASDPPKATTEASASATASGGPDSESTDSPDPVRGLAPMDFATFVMSLGSSAMINLGKIPPPGSDATQVDLPAAKQIIDILGILEEKTRGNLDESEQKLLCSLLYDLRVHYVDAQKQR
ncbi:MAG: DUF1844 domain-containing protein [Proteobacteria bacterium]|nr:DUF1844 domain-containing protein [Pseudomonadota bacterium]